MNRRTFLSWLGGTAAGAAIAPYLPWTLPTPYLKPPSVACIAEFAEIERIRARYVIPAAEYLAAQANKRALEIVWR